MRRSTIDAIKTHAVAEYPRECVGIVVVKDNVDEYWPRQNVAPPSDRKDYFVMDDMAFVDAEDAGYEVVAIVHSHPDMPARPSEADRVSCEAHSLPWLIVSVYADGPREVREVVPTGYKAPLEGRPFVHGVLDCYTLIKDFYERELGTTLRDFERKDGWWESKGAPNPYLENLAKDGWEPVQDLQPYDVILMDIRSKNGPNHGAVYLGDGQMLHHLYGRLSERTSYAGLYCDTTRMIVRHPSRMTTEVV